MSLIAAQWGTGQVFWSMMWFFLWIIWFWLLITVFADVFRSRDLGGVAKTLWIVFVILVPFLGVFVYLIARGGKMNEHAAQAAQAQEDAMRQYVQQVAPPSSTADELAKLADLRSTGVIDDADYEAAKAKALAG
jgi:ABC-type transport system involved in cytochrome bd biosynthesis fused ATPase/permease subunit